MLRAALLEEGVSAQKVQIVPPEQEAVDAALKMARPGDLVLIFADALSRTWDQVVHFHPTDEAQTSREPVTVERGRAPAADLDDGQILIRDERGVRLARETEITD